MNAETIIKSLQRQDFEIHPLTTNKCILARKGTTTLVCSLDDEIMVSISFNGSQNLGKARKVLGKIFGCTVEHLSSNPQDGIRANYFVVRELH